MPIHLLLLVFTALFLPLAATALQPIANFDQGRINALGGTFQKRQADDGKIAMRYTHTQRRGEGGRALRIDISDNPHPFSFIYMNLFDSSLPDDQRAYLPANENQWLSFWVKGAVGGEQFDIQLGDPFTLDQAKPAPGAAGFYTPEHRLSTQWQEVTIKLSAFRLPSATSPEGLQLANLVFFAPPHAQGTIFIDDISIKDFHLEEVPHTPRAQSCPPRADRALWVWESRQLVENPVQRQRFFAFCRQRQIATVFLQHLWQWDNEQQDFVLPAALAPGLDSLLAQAHEQTISVHALAGDPGKALRENHTAFFKLTQALIDYNKNRPPEARFSGIRLDVEPYILPAFASSMRDGILQEYLALVEGVAQHLQDQTMTLGVDIPFWLHQYPLAFPSGLGQEKNPVDHLLTTIGVDNIGVMAYRNTTTSTAANIIDLARTNLTLATAADKQVYIGVETYRNPPTPVYLVRQIPADQWDDFVHQRPDLVRRFSLPESPCPQCRINRVEDRAGNHYLGLTWPPGVERPAFAATLRQFFDLIEAQKPTGKPASSSWNLTNLPSSMSEFSDPTPFQDFGVSGYTVEYYMQANTTFAGLPPDQLHQALDEIEETFNPNCSFAGTAIHNYKDYRALVGDE
ncbi:MAG: hypothetical protein GKR89_33350 [Candidatus Latescibacteria bacterium]|nr:hypothetical protein [Candidatus Latescibacterota bacterium]